MRIAVLGPLEVRGDDGAPVPVPGAKERLLLAVLAAGAPAVVPADRIAEELWDGDPPASARKSLQAHLVRLRSALEPDRPRGSTGRYVVRRGPGYALTVERADLDALALGDLAARGRAALAAGDPAGARELLDGALDLWRGDPYADWPEAPFARVERRRLGELRDGALTACTEARLALGEDAALVPDLERMVAEQPLREEWWRLLVLALYRAGRQADALGAARRARAVLAEELGADPGPALRAAEAAVLAQDPGLDPVAPLPRAPAPLSGACPYMGLRAYRGEDAALFAGRDRLVATLVARLVDAPLLAVSGPSGAGKSSVVRAGLVPALAAGALPGSAGWQPRVLLPGRHPVDALAELTGEDPPARPVLLVCDQFEELWAPGVDAAERAAFLDTVLALLDDAVVARCVVVVRGDAVGRLAEHPGWVDRLGPAVVLVPPMTDPELRAVVRDPAAAVGLRVEDDLVGAVVADGLGRPGALPLLSTALVGTWERRRGDLLTLAGYVAAGGVAGALARSAEAAYAALDEPGRELARRLFVRLADVDDAGALVRRPVRAAELGTDGPRRAVVEEFLARRLLSVDADRLEVTHEALLTAWPRLARWLEDDAAGRAVRRHLTPAAAEWDRAGRPDDELYRGARLTAALDWAAGACDELTPVERDFLDASRAHAERDLADARERAAREAAARHRTRRLAGVLAVVLVLALVAAGLAVSFQRDAEDRATEAERTSRVADANWLTSRTGVASSLDTAVLLAATAVRLANTPETRDGLLALLAEHQRVARAVPFPGRVQGGRVDGTGTLWLGVGDRIVAWSTTDRAMPHVAVRLDGTWGAWMGADPSPLSDTLATSGVAGEEPWVRLVGRDGEVTRVLEGRGVGGSPLDVSYTPGGETLELLVATPPPGGPEGPAEWRLRTVGALGGAAADTGVSGTAPAAMDSLEVDLDARSGLAVLWTRGGGPAVLVDVASGAQVPLPVDARDAGSVGFQVVGDGVVQFWDDGTVTRHGRDGRVLQQLEAHTAPVRSAAVSPRGWAATAGDDGEVVRWEVDPVTGEWSRPEVLTGHRGDVMAAAADPTGQLLVTAGVDDAAIVWDMRPDGAFGADYPAMAGRWVSNRPRVLGSTGLVVVPTRPVTGVVGADPFGPPDDTRAVDATFLDPDSGAVVHEVPLGETAPGVLFGSSVAVRPDGGAVAVTWGLGASVLDAEGRRIGPDVVLPPAEEWEWEGVSMPALVLWSAGWTRDGSRLLLGSEGDPDTGEGARLLVVDPATGEVEDQRDVGVSPQAISPSPDGELLAVASAIDERVVLLDAGTLEVTDTVELLDGDRPFDVAWSPDGQLLAVVGDAGLLHVVDVATARAREPVGISPLSLLQAEWLPDGRTVATAAMDGTVTLFDVERGLPRTGPIRASPSGTAPYTHLLPGPDEELVAFSGAVPGRRYPLDPDAWLTAACELAGRDLTRAEWERFLPARAWQPTCTDLD